MLRPYRNHALGYAGVFALVTTGLVGCSPSTGPSAPSLDGGETPQAQDSIQPTAETTRDGGLDASTPSENDADASTTGTGSDAASHDGSGGTTGEPDAAPLSCVGDGDTIPHGGSRCPCESCDDILTCSNGVLESSTCPSDMFCEQAGENEIECVCTNLANNHCPGGFENSRCPSDPDCGPGGF